jgi:hypothetical protein
VRTEREDGRVVERKNKNNKIGLEKDSGDQVFKSLPGE